MFRFITYCLTLFITGFIAIYALSGSESLINIDTANFSIQTNLPFLFALTLGASILFSFGLFCIYWFTGLPTKFKKSQNDYQYKKAANEIFDLLCSIETESESPNKFKNIDVKQMEKTIDHPVVDLLDYKISNYLQNKDKHAMVLARIKNNKVISSLFYKELILSKLYSDEYEDARSLLLEFMKSHDNRPSWFYKSAIIVFSYFGDISRGKDIIKKAQKAEVIEDYALEMSNLYLGKARSLAKENLDKEECLKSLLEGLEYNNVNQEIIEVLHDHISSLRGNKKVIELLKTSWREKPHYKTLEMLFDLEPSQDDSDLKIKLLEFVKQNNSDEARVYLAKLAAVKGQYQLSVEMLEKVDAKEHNKEYEVIMAFLQIAYLNESSKEKLAILKKQMLKHV